jgi:diguanylate cyclase (GGDEF)-like protein
VRFRENLKQELVRVRPEQPIAVLCLDLDNFKAVNDTLGHPIGDALLKSVAQRLSACLQASDTVARLGGDEFVIVQAAGAQPVAATMLAQQLIETMAEPFEIEGHSVVIGTSVGIALAPNDGSDPDELLKNADMALYRAKAEGRGTYRFFEAKMDADMQARRLLEVDLRGALARNEFEVYYQPLVDLQTARLNGFEALLRWHHPQRGLVSPAEFIPLAEEIGLITPIGAWVLKQACSDAVNWPGELTVAVNLSPVQFKSKTLTLDVVAALGASGLPASRLELEITEAVMLHDTETTLDTLTQLKALGARISMDDFGTGYSSLSYLRSYPFDKIKIDRSFVGELGKKKDCVAIIRAVAGLGGSLGMTTTAEGVETNEQLEILRTEGCTQVQGYLFSPPRPARDIPGLVARFGVHQRSRYAAAARAPRTFAATAAMR